DRAWWLPRSLRAMPDVDIEGAVVEKQRQAWMWQRSLPASTALAIESDELQLHVSAQSGDVVEFISSTPQEIAPILAALSGRGTLPGRWSVMGQPLPFEAAAVRSQTRLVIWGAPIAAGELRRYLRTQLSLNGARLRGSQLENVVEQSKQIAESAGIPVAEIALTTDVSSLTADQLWAVDMAIALSGKHSVIVADTHHVQTPDHCVNFLSGLAREDAILALGLEQEVSVPGRNVIPTHVSTASGVAV
ncbi:MAG: hypothetical protein RLZZ52_634, partial [Actinomycetota bacterium]